MKQIRAFVEGKRYQTDLSPSTLAVWPIPFLTLVDMLKSDGRVFGLLADQFICSHFDNMALVTGQKSFDVLETPPAGGARVWEVKSASCGHAANLEQSRHKGKGRAFNQAEHDGRQANFYGYILVDLQTFPQVRFIGLPMRWFREHKCTRSVSRRQLNAIFCQTYLFEAV